MSKLLRNPRKLFGECNRMRLMIYILPQPAVGRASSWSRIAFVMLCNRHARHAGHLLVRKGVDVAGDVLLLGGPCLSAVPLLPWFQLLLRQKFFRSSTPKRPLNAAEKRTKAALCRSKRELVYIVAFSLGLSTSFRASNPVFCNVFAILSSIFMEHVFGRQNAQHPLIFLFLGSP